MVGLDTLFVSVPLVFTSAFILALSCFTRREDAAHKHFVFLCATLLAWNIIQAVHTASVSFYVVEFFITLQMVAIPFLPVAILMYVLKSSGFDKFCSSKYMVLACIMPAATVIINFTNDFHHLFRVYFAVVQTVPVRVMINERGPWFWIHTAYSYAAIITAVLVAVYKIKNVIGVSRHRYYMILLGCLMGAFANLFTIFVAPASPIDGTLWGCTLGLLLLYFTMDTSPTSNYILARNQVFEAIGEYIFVLDGKDIITDINRSAKNWLAGHGIQQEPTSLNALLLKLREKGAVIESDEETGQMEVFFADDNKSLFSSFAMKSSDIYDKKQKLAGKIVTFSDMTAIREKLRSLQEISTIDELTGTYNRRGYEKILADFDANNMFPLCVVMGDINGMKRVNDTLGHSSGDYVLRRSAQLLVECSSGLGTVARIGGDEFAVIIPRISGEAAAEGMIKNVNRAFADKACEMHGASIALGYAVKTEARQELSKILIEADKKMYENKQNDRRRR